MNTLCDKKIELLRPVEHLCYQVAHYLLGNACEAAAASESALIELFRSPSFVEGTEEERKRLAKEAAIRNAMRRASSMNQVPVH